MLCSSSRPGTNAVYIEGLYDPSDVVTLVRGKHILHFGVEVLMGEGDTTPWGNIDAGDFGFTGQYTAQNFVSRPPERASPISCLATSKTGARPIR